MLSFRLKKQTSKTVADIVFKKKLEYRGHVYFELVHPRFIVCTLEYLKHNNEFYRDIIVEPNNVPENLLGAYKQSSREEGILTKILEDLDYPIEVMLQSEGKRTVDSTENCLDPFQRSSNEV